MCFNFVPEFIYTLIIILQSSSSTNDIRRLIIWDQIDAMVCNTLSQSPLSIQIPFFGCIANNIIKMRQRKQWFRIGTTAYSN